MTDFRRYIQALVGQGGHLANDVDYLPAFHQQHLTKHKSDSKKDSGWVSTFRFSDDFAEDTHSFKHRVICYLVSHAVACPLPQVRASLLKSLRDIPDPSKALMLIPVYKQSFDASAGVVASTPADHEFQVALVRAFDKNAAKALNDKERPLWQVFVEVLRACLTRGKYYPVSGLGSH